MNLNTAIFFSASLIGAFNSILLSVYFIKKRSISAYFFGFLLFCLGVRIGKSVLIYFYPETPKTVLQIGLSACFFIGPSLYFFLKSEIEKVKIIPRNWKIILVVLVVFILSVGFIFPYETYPKIWNGYIIETIYITWGVFVMLSGALVFPLFFKKTNPTEKWLLAIFVGNFLISTTYFAAFLLPFPSIYISASVTFSTFFYSLLAIVLWQKKKVELFNNTIKNGSKKVENENTESIQNLLKSKMANEKLFLNPNLKLNELATEINISAHQLSQILNENFGKNFSEFINEYRINEACKMLFTHENLSIDGIGYEVGFNSKSTFFAAFKKQKGVTPAIFQQNHLKKSSVL